MEEQKQGNDHRHLELQNVTAFLELLITKYIKPWMESADSANVDAAMNLFSFQLKISEESFKDIQSFRKLIAI